MPIHVRFEGEIVVLSNVGRMMNDPRYFDAGQEVRDLLAEGSRSFIIDFRGVGEPGAPLLGILMTITRAIRKEKGEVVLAGLRQDMLKYLDEMRMEDFWEVFRSVGEAKGHFNRHRDAGDDAGRD